MRRIQLVLKKSLDESYDLEIEKGLFRRLASDLRMKRFVEEYVLITDKTVNKHVGASLLSQLKREKLLLGKIVIPSGEHSKSLAAMEKVLEQMVELGAHRKTGVIALGGGVVGDLAGFVAASFMRGVPYVHVPTTLLSMVDSSVGGKVGVDLLSGKNMVGAFWQPKKVYIDPELLSSLPMKQWKSGLAEAVKYGAIKDRSLFDFFEQHLALLQKGPKDLFSSEWKMVEEMIERCVKIKAEVVMKDEKEGGVRQILNYGHTFGHVIEQMSDFTVLHGEAIATGMRMASLLANRLRFMPDAELKKQNLLLDHLGLGKTKVKGLIKNFVQKMKHDKKSKGDLRVILVDRIGRCHQQLGNYSISVDEKLVREILKESGMIDDREANKTLSDSGHPSSAVSEYNSSLSSWQNQYDSGYPNSSSPSYSSSVYDETELQRRLREMRERRERAQREGKKWLPR